MYENCNNINFTASMHRRWGMGPLPVQNFFSNFMGFFKKHGQKCSISATSLGVGFATVNYSCLYNL